MSQLAEFGPHRLSRREWMKLSSAGVIGFSMSGWLGRLAAENAKEGTKGKRACILLWMNGGPAQTDTFDMKPDHKNGGPTKEIQTNTPGMRFTENLPKLAKLSEHLCLVRSMSTKEADHGRATQYLRTGRMPGGSIQYPTMGSFISKELDREDLELPSFVSVAPYRIFAPAAYQPGFLGPVYAPLIVGEVQNFGQQGRQTDYDQALKVKDLDLPKEVSEAQAEARVKLLEDMEEDFLKGRPGVAAASHKTAYHRAVKMMRSAASKAFNLEEEKDEVRDSYGRNLFGQGCLLARRLVERGVPFVEVTLGGLNNNGLGWDTHQNSAQGVKQLCELLDPAWSQLMIDLKERDQLKDTLIVWMGEFGRTPKITQGSNGREHWANSWTTVLAGGGVKGGAIYGKTSESGEEIKENPVGVPEFLATVCGALGIDHKKQNMSNVQRPIRLVDPGAEPIKEILA